MLILILRHGEAEGRDGETERHLTNRGSAQVNSVLGLAKQMGVRVDSILSSPVARAKETASLASDIFGPKLAVTNALEPEGSPEEVYEELMRIEGKSVLLVSHQPLVSKLVEDFLESAVPINMMTGSLAMIMAKDRPSRGSGVLVSLIPPLIANS